MIVILLLLCAALFAAVGWLERREALRGLPPRPCRMCGRWIGHWLGCPLTPAWNGEGARATDSAVASANEGGTL